MSTPPQPPPLTLTTFTLLPRELRLKIYTHTLLLTPPRLINIHTTLYPNPDYDSDLDSPDIARDGSLKLTIKCYHIPHQFISLQSLPHSLLHVSRESRGFVLGRCERGVEVSGVGRKWMRFPGSCEHVESVKRNESGVYIDGRRDVLFFHWFDGGDGKDSEIEEKNMVYMGLLDRCVIKCAENVAVDGQCFVGWVVGEMEIPDLRWTRVLVVVRRSGRPSPQRAEDDGDDGGVEVGSGSGEVEKEDEYPLYKDKEWRIGADVLREEERRGVDIGGVLESILRKKIRKGFGPKTGFRIGVVESKEHIFGFAERFGRC